jgi:hypothetical protein
MGQTFSKWFGSLFNKIAEVDNEVDNEQIPQPELEYGLILHDNIDESLQALYQTNANVP